VAVAAARKARVLWGSSFEDVGGGPFRPWIMALRGRSSGLEPAQLAALTGPEAPVLAEVVARLVSDECPRVMVPGDPEASRLRLFEAAASFLRRLGEDRLTIVVLDDLQWADGVSLLLLQHLAREVAGMRVLVVATYRYVDLARAIRSPPPSATSPASPPRCASPSPA
jgi:hypothetical protein